MRILFFDKLAGVSSNLIVDLIFFEIFFHFRKFYTALCCSLSAGYLCGRPRGESNVWPTKQDYHAFAAEERCGQNWNRVFTFFRSKKSLSVD